MKKIPKIYVLVGYGDESETFIRSRKLWSDYIKNHDINFYFNVLTPSLASDLVLEVGDELRVGCSELHTDSIDKSSYSKNYTWNKSERFKFIHRRVMTFQYLLNKEPEPFWVLNTTVTSAISIKRIKKIIENYDCSNFFGGAPIFKDIPFGNDFFVMLSGAGHLLSSDVLRLVVDRSQSMQWDCLDDVWTSLILFDIPRVPLKRYDFTYEKSYSEIDVKNISEKIDRAFQEGHYHFRVKSPLNNGIKREDLDPLILKQIFDAIKRSEENESFDMNKLLSFHSGLRSLNEEGKLLSIAREN